MQLTPNMHVLRVSYGSQYVTVKSLRFNQSLRYEKYTERLDNDLSYLENIILDLQAKGFNIIAKGEFGENMDVLVTDTFKPFRKEA